MTAKSDQYEDALDRAADHAKRWLDRLVDRPVGPRASADQLLSTFRVPLPDKGTRAADVVDQLAEGAEPGLMASQSGRFYGWVIGGTLPAALAADWMVSAWDQNAAMRYATPAAAALEEVAAGWLLELLGLPVTADLGFVTGATMANFVGLASARGRVFGRAGWDVNSKGLIGAPRVHVLVGAERHGSVDLALRYLGFGQPLVVGADDEGRIDVDALAAALDKVPAGEPIITCLQAGNLHSGAFDPFGDAAELTHRRDGWVHVDGAFGLWAAACPSLSHLVGGLETADSWASDAHKTLNVPYDCGIVVVADRAAVRSAMGMQADYLIADANPGPGDPSGRAPEMSRRARGIPVWAALSSLGRQGVIDLVERLTMRARSLARGLAAIDGAEVLNDVVYTQLAVSFGDDDRTRAVTERIISGGATWMSGSRWHGREVLRVSCSNWSTDEDDVRVSLDAVARAASA